METAAAGNSTQPSLKSTCTPPRLTLGVPTSTRTKLRLGGILPRVGNLLDRHLLRGSFPTGPVEKVETSAGWISGSRTHRCQHAPLLSTPSHQTSCRYALETAWSYLDAMVKSNMLTLLRTLRACTHTHTRNIKAFYTTRCAIGKFPSDQETPIHHGHKEFHKKETNLTPEPKQRPGISKIQFSELKKEKQ